VIAATYTASAVDPVFHQRWFSSEEGFLEWVTVILLVPAAWFGARSALRVPDLTRRTFVRRSWFALTFVCVYFAGEEISWGQKIFFWDTPEFIGALNDQNETNLHNISSWFDQKPRLLFEVWVLVAGVVVPIRQAMQGVTYAQTQWQCWFWPTGVCVPAAALALLSMVPEWTKDVFGLPPFPVEVRYSELQEFYFSLFLFLYFASAWRRLQG
jgi:hypothetical protein